MSEPADTRPPNRMILRVGQGRNVVCVTVPGYRGPHNIGPELIGALFAELDRRYSGAGWKWCDRLEILGYETDP
jgi:hypothetical protein